MKRFLVLFLLVVPILAFSATMPEILKDAQASNTTYRLAQLSARQAGMDYQMGLIQASDEGAKLSAEITYTTSESNYLKSMESYYKEVVDAAFGVIKSEVNLEIGALNLQIATSDYRNTLSLFKNSLASTDDLETASVTVANAKNNLANYKWSLDSAKNAFTQATGKKWQDMTVTAPSFSSLPSGYETWLGNDFSVKTSDLNLQLALYNQKKVPANSSKYTAESADIGVQQAQINYDAAKVSSNENYLSARQSLEYSYNALLNTQSNLRISKDALDNLKVQYDQGIVSVADYLNQQIQYLTSKVGYYESLNSYFDAIGSYLLEMGVQPAEVTM